MSFASFIRRLFGHDRNTVAPPLGYEQALKDGYADALRDWTRKHGRNHTLTIPVCIWVAKTRWTTDDNGQPLEMGGWNLSPRAYAMWTGQYPLRGSIAHEIKHCWDLQVFGKTSEESVR